MNIYKLGRITAVKIHYNSALTETQ